MKKTILTFLLSLFFVASTLAQAQTVRVRERLMEIDNTTPKKGSVSFVLTKQATSAGGIIVAGATQTFDLVDGWLDARILANDAMTPEQAYNVTYNAPGKNGVLMGLYSFTYSTSVQTLSANLVVDVNKNARLKLPSYGDVNSALASAGAAGGTAGAAAIVQTYTSGLSNGALPKWDATQGKFINNSGALNQVLVSNGDGSNTWYDPASVPGIAVNTGTDARFSTSGSDPSGTSCTPGVSAQKIYNSKTFFCDPASNTYNFTSINIVTPASAQGGASATAKIDAALTAAASTGIPVWIDKNVGNTTSAPTTLVPNVTAIDTRGGQGYDIQGLSYGSFFPEAINFNRKTTQVYTTGEVPSVLKAYYHAQYGGINNDGGPKVDYRAVSGLIWKQTIGQTSAVTGEIRAEGDGDAQALVGILFYNANSTEGGGEGATGVRGNVIHSGDVFTGTVSAIATNTLSFTSTTNTFSQGQNRYLINTNAAKVYSTGTITNITGTPPVVTGSGTNWTSLGSGAVTGLYFVMNQDTTNYSKKVVVPIRSIDSNTQITLDYHIAGNDYPWHTAFSGYSTVTYKIYKGSAIARVNDSTTQVVSASNFAVSDTVECPVGYAAPIAGARFSYNLLFPTSKATSGLELQNYGTVPIRNAIAVGGPHKRGLEFNGTLSESGIIFGGLVGTNGVGPLITYTPATFTTIFQSATSTAGISNFNYDKANDYYTFGSSGLTYHSNDGRLGVNGFSTSARALIQSAGSETQLLIRQTGAVTNLIEMKNSGDAKIASIQHDSGGNMIFRNTGVFFFDAGTDVRFRGASGSNDMGQIVGFNSKGYWYLGDAYDGDLTAQVSVFALSGKNPLRLRHNGSTVATVGTKGEVIQTGVAFASLPGSPANGTFIYCSDCTIASPCASGGSGAFAKRLNGAWVCN